MKIKQKGFTLVELLVVVFIIGILASLVVVNIARSRMKARDARRKADLYDVANAIEMYYSQKHKFPGQPDVAYNLYVSETGISDFISEYLPKPPYDPSCRNDACSSNYIYKKTSQGKYCLYARLENEKDQDLQSMTLQTPVCGQLDSYNYFIEK